MDAEPAPVASRRRRPAARQHVTAAWLTFHFLCVFIFILPYPPYFDDRTLALPEVKAEMSRFFGGIHRLAPVFHSADELQANTVKFLRAYMDVYFRARRWFAEPYLELTGSTQSWNMFGGSPPRHPKSLMVEIQARGSPEWVLFRDHRWGTPDHARATFRDFKAHEILGLVGWNRQREWYANDMARRWNAEHPDRPAEQVRLFYLQFTTPPASERLPDGTLPRTHKRVQEFTWRPRLETTP